jgi:hypothetical protein
VKTRAGLIAAIVASFALTGCREDQQNADGSLSSDSGGRQMSVIGSLRPKADPNVLEKIHEEDEQKRKAAEAALAQQQQALQQQNQAADPANRDLPAVDQNPISGIANALGFNTGAQPGTSPSMNPNASMNAGIPTMSTGSIAPPPPQTAMYGGYPSVGGAGMIPPPPAVSLTTAASPYQPPVDPNYQAYMNAGAYGGGYYQQPPPQYQPQAMMPAHPAGSMFSNGGGNTSSAPPPEERKRPVMALITPTGMDARSPYKQRDDLKVLVKGAFSSTRYAELRDPKVAAILTRTDVGLPAEGTKGNLSVSPRQMASLFKNPVLDKRVWPAVGKLEQDVAQSYYRYLYAYNKYALTQQQVAARKQEMDMADSGSEKQRAAADLSTAQNDAEAAKEDLRAAQSDLASASGPQAARSVITKVSGVAPSIESLAVADEPQQTEQGGFMGTMSNAIGALNFWNKGKKEGDGQQVASSPVQEKSKPVKDKENKENKKDKKDKKKGKGDGGGSAQVAANSPADDSESIAERPTPAAAAPSAGISFELKNVQTTPRKSVLKVSVRNNGGESFNLDPDVISVLEGDKRLAEASVLAQFDSTLVAPNAEVTGTITIFGRPWNDKLTVSLSDGGKSVQLRR